MAARRSVRLNPTPRRRRRGALGRHWRDQCDQCPPAAGLGSSHPAAGPGDSQVAGAASERPRLCRTTLRLFGRIGPCFPPLGRASQNPCATCDFLLWHWRTKPACAGPHKRQLCNTVACVPMVSVALISTGGRSLSSAWHSPAAPAGGGALGGRPRGPSLPTARVRTRGALLNYKRKPAQRGRG